MWDRLTAFAGGTRSLTLTGGTGCAGRTAPPPWAMGPVRSRSRVGPADQELDDELRAVRDLLADERYDAGVSAASARRAANLELGGLEQVKERVRQARAGAMLDALLIDTRYAARELWRSRAFAATAITTLSLGVGVNAAVFAVVYGLLFRPLPYAEPSRLVVLSQTWADGADVGASPRIVRAWFDGLATVADMAAYKASDVTVRCDGQSSVVPTAFVSEGFFRVLGIAADRGVAEVDIDRVSVSRSLARRLGERVGPTSIGRGLRVGDQSVSVGGIMPSRFAFPSNVIDELWAHDSWPAATFRTAISCPVRRS